MADAGELFVKVRPNTAGFTSEASGPMASAGRDLSKVFLAAFAIGGIATTIRSVVEAATSHQAAFAVLNQTVKDAGAANVLYGKSIEGLLESEARLKGFSDEDLASAFQRLVSVTHDSAKAFAILGNAEDLARFRHIDLATAALALAKEQQGSNNSLQRYGITLAKVTTAEDALKQKHDETVASGYKLTQQDKELYASALDVAKAQDKAATAAAGLALVQERTGGAAAVFADTAAGHFARLGVDIHQLKVAIGEELLPDLTAAAEDLGKLIQEMHKFGAPVVEATNHVGGLVHILEALGIAVGARALVAKLTATAVAETAVGTSGGIAATSISALTAALIANTAALTGETAAVGASTVIFDAYGGVLATVATAEAVVGTEAEAAAAKVGFLRASLLRLGTLAAIAIPVEIILNHAAIQREVDKLLIRVHLGFLTGDQESLASLKEKAAKDGGIYADAFKSIVAKERITALGGGAGAQQAKQDLLSIGIGHAHGFLGSFLTDSLNAAVDAVLADAKAGGRAHQKLEDAGKAAIEALRQGITTDQTDLTQLKTDMADSITQGAEAVDQAVQQAKQNLNAIGQSLAQSLATFVDKPLNDAAQRLSDAQDRIAAVYDRKSAALNAKIAAVSAQQAQISALGNRQSLENIRQEITLPGGKTLSKDPREALRELDALQAAATAKLGHADPALAAYILQYRSASLQVTADQLNLKKSALDARHTAATTGIQLSTDALKLRQDAAAHQVQVAATGIANLTDELNKGLINPSEFEIQLNKILAKNHLTFIAAAKRDGIAFADTFNAQLTGLVEQEAALIGGPARTGTGLIPSIVRPIETLQQTQKTIAGLASQERGKQLDETKKQTALLKKIHADRAGAAFTSSLTKNPGGASTKQKDLVGASG